MPPAAPLRPGHRPTDLGSLRWQWACQICRRPRGPWSFYRHANDRSLGTAPPFSARRRAMRLGTCAVDGMKIFIRRQAAQCLKQLLPEASPRPAVPTIIDRRVRAIDRRAIAPAATRLQNMNDAANDPAIIDTTRTGLVARQMTLYRLPLCIAQPKLMGHDPLLRYCPV